MNPSPVRPLLSGPIVVKDNALHESEYYISPVAWGKLRILTWTIFLADIVHSVWKNVFWPCEQLANNVSMSTIRGQKRGSQMLLSNFNWYKKKVKLDKQGLIMWYLNKDLQQETNYLFFSCVMHHCQLLLKSLYLCAAVVQLVLDLLPLPSFRL